jgi:outer membrane protein assembly factor BamB
MLCALACAGHLATAIAVHASAVDAGEATGWPVDLTLPLRALWRMDAGQAPLSTWRAPLRDGLVILPEARAVEARHARSGEIVWRHTFADMSPRCAVFHQDLVVVGGVANGEATDLRGLDIETGELRFEARLGGIFVAPVAVGSNLIVASSHSLAALDADWTIRWRVDFPRQADGFPGGPLLSRPALLNGLALVGTADSRLHAYDLDDGSERFAVALPQQLHSGGASDGKQVVIAIDGLILSLDGEGHERWRLPVAGDPLFASPRIAGGVVFVATGTGESILAVEAASGLPLWHTPLGARVFSHPAITRHHLIVGDMGNRLTVLDQATGEITGQSSLDSGAGIHLSDPVVEEGLVGVGTADGIFHMLESVEEPEETPVATIRGRLLASPNPFVEEVTLSIDQGEVPAAGSAATARLSIYDANGRLRSVVELPEGSPWRWGGHDTWGRRLAAGIYFLKLETDAGVRTTKVELLR